MQQQRGFSLLEMTIVILVLSLILASTAQFLRVQSEYKALKATDKQLQVIREALLGFATLENRLPCPAADENGQAETTLCDAEGYLPWVDLAIDGRDAWGNIFRYRIDKNFASDIPDDVQTYSNLKIKNVAGTIDWTVANSSATCKKNASTIVVCSRVVAIFFSVGANKHADSRNTGGDATYAYDEYSDDFDDRLLWLGVSDLVGGMLRVGKWPF
ncbi:type II secretion system protein [Candidatus Albibeggiatoa sp. nov. BB20]|uniref:type II secretion system protein n=1 Tax=Candidatus Albibeggiatoa sp. nov. BB20 TaxID=3162723 RepID=UPI0033656F74